MRTAADQIPTLLDRIGNTPLLALHSLDASISPGVRVLGKAEFLNPGGSVKDRPALNMIQEAERRGEIGPGKSILEATSGNTGIALAMIGAVRGYEVVLCLPANASQERIATLRAYGARLVLTDPGEMIDGAIHEARMMYERSPERWYYANQYANEDNWKAHYQTTGPEILAQTRGGITHFVAGLGTSGTFVGAGRAMRDARADVRLVSMQPDSSWHGLEGLKHMESALVPAIYDDGLADENVTVVTEAAQAMTRMMARRLGIFAGVSAGANVTAALRIARTLDSGTVVTVLCDGGERYTGDSFWNEE
ncbi:MAG: cysteine synthase family protein [Gemmatimonadetes bacterium]|nr:cysteine synthase family protein [Gemmatimonadota bacterium]